MKCQKCGENDAIFHYSSNINGSMTQAHLCKECANEARMGMGGFGGFGNIGEGFAIGNIPGGIFAIPLFGFGMMPAGSRQSMQEHRQPMGVSPLQPMEREPLSEMDESLAMEGEEVDVDHAMEKRREINIIREQMNQAARENDFVKAASLRDQLKGMEDEYDNLDTGHGAQTYNQELEE